MTNHRRHAPQISLGQNRHRSSRRSIAAQDPRSRRCQTANSGGGTEGRVRRPQGESVGATIRSPLKNRNSSECVSTRIRGCGQKSMTNVSTGPQGQAPVHAIESSAACCRVWAGAAVPFFAQQLFAVVTTRAAQHPFLPADFAPLAQQQRPAARDSAEQRQTSFDEFALTCGPNPVGNPKFMTTYISSTNPRERLCRLIRPRALTKPPRTRSIWCRSIVNGCRTIIVGQLGGESEDRNDLNTPADRFNLVVASMWLVRYSPTVCTCLVASRNRGLAGWQ